MDGAELIFKYFPELNEIQRDRFRRLGALYAEWNAKLNLISRNDFVHFYERHVLYSLGIAKVIHFANGTKLMDAGTGGGFPGIPLAILFPDVEFLLVDSIGKKIKAVADVAEQLKLQNVRVENERFEKIEESFDFVVSRATMPLVEMVPTIKINIRKESRNTIANGLIYLKGGDFTEELKSLGRPSAVTQLNSIFSEAFFETKSVIVLDLSH